MKKTLYQMFDFSNATSYCIAQESYNLTGKKNELVGESIVGEYLFLNAFSHERLFVLDLLL